MSFGDFYTRICDQLKEGYGWRGAVMYLAVHPELLNIIYNDRSRRSSRCIKGLHMLAVDKRMPKSKDRERRLQVVLDATERIFSDHTFSRMCVRSIRKKILGPMPNQEEYNAAKAKIQLESVKNNVSAELLPCWQEPLLSKAQEQHLSKKFNYLKSLARDNALKGRLVTAERFLSLAQESRQILSLANMRLAINVIKRTYSSRKEDLLSEAYLSVYKATEYFDWRKGFKFSTYATWVISKNVWHINTILQKEDVFQASDFDLEVSRDVGLEQEFAHAANVKVVEKLLVYLDDGRERDVIKMRFGIGTNQFTLQEIGALFNVSKERIRQIEERAIRKLRGILGKEVKAA